MADAIDNDSTRFISAVSVVETTIVIESRRGHGGVKALNLYSKKKFKKKFKKKRQLT